MSIQLGSISQVSSSFIHLIVFSKHRAELFEALFFKNAQHQIVFYWGRGESERERQRQAREGERERGVKGGMEGKRERMIGEKMVIKLIPGTRKLQ